MSTLKKKERTFIYNLFFTTILGGVIGLLNYAFNILIAKHTSTEIFGTFSATLGIIYLSQISGVAIQSLITKTVGQNKMKNLNLYKWNSLLIFSVIGVITAVIFFLFRHPIAEIASLPVEYMLYLAIAIIFAFASPVAKGLLLGEEKIITVNLVLLAETIVKFAIGIVSIKMGGNIPLLIMANALPAMLSTLIIIPLLRYKKGEAIVIKQNWKEFILMAFSFILLTMPFTLDLILVNESFRASYSSLSLLGKIVYFACITTSSVMFARLANEKDAKSQRKSLITAIALSLLIGIVLSLAFFFFGGKIIELSVGEKYLPIMRYLGVFGLCMTGYSLVYMIANYFISKGTYSYILILLSATMLQILLFATRNDGIKVVVDNQIILYSLLTVSTVLFLLIKFKKDIQNERREENIKNKS